MPFSVTDLTTKYCAKGGDFLGKISTVTNENLLGVPFLPIAIGIRSGFTLQVLAKLIVKKYFHSAAGFPLQSLTQKKNS